MAAGSFSAAADEQALASADAEILQCPQNDIQKEALARAGRIVLDDGYFVFNDV